MVEIVGGVDVAVVTGSLLSCWVRVLWVTVVTTVATDLVLGRLATGPDVHAAPAIAMAMTVNIVALAGHAGGKYHLIAAT
ncbi:MAG: hypothetical protein WCI22_09400 [Actinomycetota bacterium]